MGRGPANGAPRTDRGALGEGAEEEEAAELERVERLARAVQRDAEEQAEQEAEKRALEQAERRAAERRAAEQAAEQAEAARAEQARRHAEAEQAAAEQEEAARLAESERSAELNRLAMAEQAQRYAEEQARGDAELAAEHAAARRALEQAEQAEQAERARAAEGLAGSAHRQRERENEQAEAEARAEARAAAQAEAASQAEAAARAEAEVVAAAQEEAVAEAQADAAAAKFGEKQAAVVAASARHQNALNEAERVADRYSEASREGSVARDKANATAAAAGAARPAEAEAARAAVAEEAEKRLGPLRLEAQKAKIELNEASVAAGLARETIQSARQALDAAAAVAREAADVLRVAQAKSQAAKAAQARISEATRPIAVGGEYPATAPSSNEALHERLAEEARLQRDALVAWDDSYGDLDSGGDLDFGPGTRGAADKLEARLMCSRLAALEARMKALAAGGDEEAARDAIMSHERMASRLHLEIAGYWYELWGTFEAPLYANAFESSAKVQFCEASVRLHLASAELAEARLAEARAEVFVSLDPSWEGIKLVVLDMDDTFLTGNIRAEGVGIRTDVVRLITYLLDKKIEVAIATGSLPITPKGEVVRDVLLKLAAGHVLIQEWLRAVVIVFTVSTATGNRPSTLPSDGGRVQEVTEDQETMIQIENKHLEPATNRIVFVSPINADIAKGKSEHLKILCDEFGVQPENTMIVDDWFSYPNSSKDKMRLLQSGYRVPTFDPSKGIILVLASDLEVKHAEAQLNWVARKQANNVFIERAPIDRKPLCVVALDLDGTLHQSDFNGRLDPPNPDVMAAILEVRREYGYNVAFVVATNHPRAGAIASAIREYDAKNQSEPLGIRCIFCQPYSGRIPNEAHCKTYMFDEASETFRDGVFYVVDRESYYCKRNVLKTIAEYFNLSADRIVLVDDFGADGKIDDDRNKTQRHDDVDSVIKLASDQGYRVVQYRPMTESDLKDSLMGIIISMNRGGMLGGAASGRPPTARPSTAARERAAESNRRGRLSSAWSPRVAVAALSFARATWFVARWSGCAPPGGQSPRAAEPREAVRWLAEDALLTASGLLLLDGLGADLGGWRAPEACLRSWLFAAAVAGAAALALPDSPQGRWAARAGFLAAVAAAPLL